MRTYLTQSELPRRMAGDLKWPLRLVQSTIATAPHRYKTYTIPKRGGGRGRRTISQPTSRVKDLQCWVVDRVLRELPVHDSAMGYIRARSIVDNALRHSRGRFLLKMDFADFFPSLRPRDLNQLLVSREESWSEHDLEVLSHVLFKHDARRRRQIAAIGAPSSPALSNALMYDFDVAVHAIAADAGVVYTRYADDLVFSTRAPNVLSQVHEQVLGVVHEQSSPRLRLNPAKTVHTSMRHRRVVTGLVISNDGSVGLGRSKRREIRARVHRYALGRIVDSRELAGLAGLLAYVKMVEPAGRNPGK